MPDKKPKKAGSASLNEVFIKDQVLSMKGTQVVSRRPRKKGEGKDNSVSYFNALWNKKPVK